MASFDDIIASVLDAKNVGKKKYVVHPDEIAPGETYDDGPTLAQRKRNSTPRSKYFRDPPIPPEETNDRNVINPDNSPVIEYWDNENIKANAKYRTSRKA